MLMTKFVFPKLKGFLAVVLFFSELSNIICLHIYLSTILVFDFFLFHIYFIFIYLFIYSLLIYLFICLLLFYLSYYFCIHLLIYSLILIYSCLCYSFFCFDQNLFS